MNDISFLWINREKPTDFKRWCIVWIKRLLLFIPLIKIFLRKAYINLRGGNVGRLSILSTAQFNGPLKKLYIGSHTSLGSCKIHLHDKIQIGNNVTINDGVELLSGTHKLSDPEWKLKTGVIVIDDYAWIATNAIILPGVHVGRGAVVGAGAVVRKSVPAYSVVLGNPAILIDAKRTENLIYSPVIFNAPYEAWIGKNANIK